MPNNPRWTVDNALEEVSQAVSEGAHPLEVPASTADELKRRYRVDFERQADAGADWPHDRNRVLPLARRVGKRAMAMTIGRWQSLFPDEPFPKEVDPELTYLAAYLVAKTYQTASGESGAYCKGMFISGTRDVEKLLDPILDQVRAARVEL